MRFVRILLMGVIVLVAMSPGSVHADVNNFSLHSFEADYYLTRTEDNRSHLKVVEKIVARFPDYDQNHGLIRAIPASYDGHPVHPKIVAVQNISGSSIEYQTTVENDNLILRIGDPEQYVRGMQTYRVTYKLTDVTKNFSSQDEFFWDVNGTQWLQPVGIVVARLHLAGALAYAYQDQDRSSCYTGQSGSRQSDCKITLTGRNDDITLTYTSTQPLNAKENMSIVAALNTQTFAPYKQSVWEKMLPWLIGSWLGVGVIIALAVGWRIVRAWLVFGRSPKGGGVIVPEYLPYKGMSVLDAASIVRKPTYAMAAQIIDLAVRHHIKIYEIEQNKQWWSGAKKTYEIELVQFTRGLLPEERAVIHLLFGKDAVAGARRAIDALSKTLYKNSVALQQDVDKGLMQEGYIADITVRRRPYYWLAGMQMLFVHPATFIGGIGSLIAVASWRPLTSRGSEARDYMRGLEMYMQLAEAERLRILQSPTGALQHMVPGDKRHMVKLHEHLLPYAIIFGMEKEWAKQLAHLYTQPPDWYSGNWSTFTAAHFASSLGGFTTASTYSFSLPSSSSSSGFSGGSSGGGGGGGGGGGW